MKTYVLWAVKDGSPSWMEEVIAEVTNPTQIETAKEKAIENGFGRFRVMIHNTGDMPNFTGTINI
jgi:hypothetical protein